MKDEKTVVIDINLTRGLVTLLALALLIVALLGATNVMASGGAAPLLQSGAPGQLNYQGLLLDPATGNPVADGDYTLTFAIYDHATSTDASHRLWNETTTVSVQDGLFNVILGAVTPITTTWLDGRDLWLGITIQGESEMTPRTQLVSMPYALNAKDVRGTDIHPDYVYAGNGVEVGSASGDGVYVDTAGSPSMASSSSDPNGFEVAGAEGDGLSVGHADGCGVRVSSAGGDGVYVNMVGSPSTTSPSTHSNGLEVAGAERDGLYIGRADYSGVHVASAGGFGVNVVSAGFDGVHVGSASQDGVNVNSAGQDGVYVHAAGNPSATSPDDIQPNGFEVAGAEGHGLYVGQADYNGVHVDSAGNYGVFVSSADFGGVVVDSAGQNGVWVGSAGGDGVRVVSAGNPSATSLSDLDNGFEVAGAEGHGLYVGQADQDGVHVEGATGYAGYFNGDVRVTDELQVNGPATGFFPRPTWDSGWQSIYTGGSTLTHNVGGDPDDYFVDMQCRHTSTWGINTRGLGGNYVIDLLGPHDTGAFYQLLTSSTVEVYRYSDDWACEQVRIRIWLIR